MTEMVRPDCCDVPVAMVLAKEKATPQMRSGSFSVCTHVPSAGLKATTTDETRLEAFGLFAG